MAMPLDWDELGASDMHPRRYGMGNVFRRMARKEDPWKETDRQAGTLDGPVRDLQTLREEEGASG